MAGKGETVVNHANEFAPSWRQARALRRILCLNDFEAAAKARLPRPIFGYVAGAAEDNQSLAANRQSFSNYALVPQVLRDVSQRTQAVELFGQRYSSPFGIAPMGIVAMSAYRGDVVLARAAHEAAVLSVISATSLIALEVTAAANPNAWFQAYLPGDQQRIDALLDRIETASISTLMVTVDIPVNANRENNIRTGFSTPLKPSLRLALDGALRPGWAWGTLLRTLRQHGMPHFENSFATRGAPILSSNVLRDFAARDHLSWEHLRAIRRRWKGPLLIKGVLAEADAVMAKQIGIDGIVVSNHGGRQLDGAVAPLQVLPGIVRAVGTDYPVLLDGGIRRGSDVLKALALGARAVLVGRPFNYAAAVAGEAGVRHAIGLLQAEVSRNMGMMGVNSCAELGAQHVQRCLH